MTHKTTCEQLAAAIGAGDSKLIPAIFQALTDEHEAELLLAAAPPATVAELSERTGLEAGDIEEMIDPLFTKGLLFKSKKPEGTRYYRVRHVLQLHDSTAVALDFPAEVRELWKEYMEGEWQDYGKKFEAALPRPVLRVIPVDVSVEPDSRVLAFEDLEKLVGDARNLAVTRCSCRAIDGACGKPLEVCIQVDRAADYAIERGTGRPLTKDETLEMLKMCAEEGLVHTAENRRALGHVICNCCSDCCLNWTFRKTGLGKFVAPSRFRARIVEEECNGCELCVERCYFDAMSMTSEGELAAVNEENCMGCGLCRVVCPTDAIYMQEARPEEFIPA